MSEASAVEERKLLLKILYTGRDYITDILALQKEIEDKDQEIAAHEKWGVERREKSFYRSLGSDICFCVMAFIANFGVWFALFSSGVELPFLSYDGDGWNVICFILAVGGIICFLYLQYQSASAKKACSDFTREWEISGIQKLDDINKQKSELIAKRKDLVRNKAVATLSLLPPKYIYLEAIDYFIDVVTNMRADTIKEAVNLYEEHLHRQRMEAAQNKLMEQQDKVLQLQQENKAILDSISQSIDVSNQRIASDVHTLEELAMIQYLRK